MSEEKDRQRYMDEERDIPRELRIEGGEERR